jgi:hypothetical protein
LRESFPVTLSRKAAKHGFVVAERCPGVNLSPETAIAHERINQQSGRHMRLLDWLAAVLAVLFDLDACQEKERPRNDGRR